MKPWTKFINVSAVFLLLVVSLRSSSVRATGAEEIQNFTLLHPCEIALLLDGSRSVSDTDFKQMIEVVRQFPEHFKMGDNHTRVAVIVFSDKPEIVFNLTANESLVRELDPRHPKGYTVTNEALKEVNEKLFVDARPEAMKIIILITDGLPENGLRELYHETEQAAAELKKNGSFIYVAFVGKRIDIARKHIENVAGDPSQVFALGNFQQLQKTILEDLQEHIICHFEEICRFEDADQKVCNATWYRPVVTDSNCTNVPPDRPLPQCEDKDCEDVCAKWKWTPWTCDETNAGQEQTIKREGPPPNEVFEQCETEKTVSCPPGPGAPTTHGPPTEPGASPTGPGASSTGPTSKNPDAPAVGPKESKHEESEWAPWAIGVVTLGCVLVAQFIAVLSAIVYHNRRKKVRAREAENLLKKRLKEEEMKKAKEVASMERSSRTVEVSVRGGKVVDDSMQVSLAETKKVGGASSAKSSKPTPKAGMPVKSTGTPPQRMGAKSKSMAGPKPKGK